MGKSKSPISDLRHPIGDNVLANHPKPTGQSMLVEVDGYRHLLHLDQDLILGDRYSRRLKAEQEWFEKLIKHAPSIGTFYEDALRALVEELLPGTLKLGTGFVCDPNSMSNSRQLDILVYDDSQMAPLYRRDSFCVVVPRLSVSQAEVKKTLTARELRKVIRSTFLYHFGQHANELPGCHRICLFSYSSKISAKKAYDIVAEEIADLVASFSNETNAGKSVKLTVQSVTLPQLFFLDRGEFITTRLERQDGKNPRLIISENQSGSGDSLNEFLNQMVSSHLTDERFDERDLRTRPLYNYGRQQVVVDEVFLVQSYAMLDLVQKFPDDAASIKKFKYNDETPHSVVLPVSIDLSKMSGFEELANMDIAIWQSL